MSKAPPDISQLRTPSKPRPSVGQLVGKVGKSSLVRTLLYPSRLPLTLNTAAAGFMLSQPTAYSATAIACVCAGFAIASTIEAVRPVLQLSDRVRTGYIVRSHLNGIAGLTLSWHGVEAVMQAPPSQQTMGMLLTLYAGVGVLSMAGRAWSDVTEKNLAKQDKMVTQQLRYGLVSLARKISPQAWWRNVDKALLEPPKTDAQKAAKHKAELHSARQKKRHLKRLKLEQQQQLQTPDRFPHKKLSQLKKAP